MVKNSKLWLSTVSALALALSPAASPLVQPAFSEEDPSEEMPEEAEDSEADQEDDADEADEEEIIIPNIDFENLTEIQITDESGSTSTFTGDVLEDLISGFEDMPDDFPIDVDGVTSATFTDASGGMATVSSEELEQLIEFSELDEDFDEDDDFEEEDDDFDDDEDDFDEDDEDDDVAGRAPTVLSVFFVFSFELDSRKHVFRTLDSPARVALGFWRASRLLKHIQA